MNFRKTKIDWCTHTWNPVSGCLHGCDYCYARRIAQRFGPHVGERPMVDKDSGAVGILREPDAEGCYTICHAVKLADHTGKYTRSTPYPKGFAPTFSAHLLNFPEKNQAPARVFVCNMGDLFGAWVPDKWIETVFESCKRADRHVYMFLTKNPSRYIQLAQAGKLPKGDNFWYGSTITNPDTDYFWANEYNTFLSIEPLLSEFCEADNFGSLLVDWVIIGAMTGPGANRHKPKKGWVQTIVNSCREAAVPVFMKGNLEETWAAPLIQEYPAAMMAWAKEEPNNGKT